MLVRCVLAAPRMPLPRQRRRHVAVVVVVAEDGEDAVRRVQRRQQLGDRLDERAIAERDVVAAEHDQIGRRAMRQLHRARRHRRRGTSAL